jgi:hypothetical protein
VGQVFLASEEPQHRPPLLRNLIADRPAEHGIAGLHGVENGALRDRTLNIELHLGPNLR